MYHVGQFIFSVLSTSHIFLHPASSVWITVTHELSTLAGLAIQDEHLQRTSCRGETIFLLKIAENHQGGHIYHLGGGKNQIKGLNLSGYLLKFGPNCEIWLKL